MRIVQIVCLVLLSMVCTGAVWADPPQWTAIGPAGTQIQGFDFVDGDACALTSDGFLVYDASFGSWTEILEPGVPGRAVSAVGPYMTGHLRAITGRIDASGHGTLEFTYLDGRPNQMTYQGSAGPFVAIASMQYLVDNIVWAASQADGAAGELVRSDDYGASWTPVTGHGMTDFTDLVIDINEAYEAGGMLYAAGDAGVVRTPDGGATWESFSVGLPPVPVADLAWMDSAIPVLLPGKTDMPLPMFFAATSQGLYICDNSESDWVQALPEACSSVHAWAWSAQSGAALVVTDDGRLMAGFVGQDLQWDWEDWTASLGGVVPQSVRFSFSSQMYVSTENDGVLRNAVWLVDVPDATDRLNLQATPNPFNPATVIRFESPRDGQGRLDVYDLQGRHVANLVDGPMTAGAHEMTWRPTQVSSGVYLVRLIVGQATAVTRVVLAK